MNSLQQILSNILFFGDFFALKQQEIFLGLKTPTLNFIISATGCYINFRKYVMCIISLSLLKKVKTRVSIGGKEWSVLVLFVRVFLTLLVLTPQKGQIHSNNAAAKADEFLSVFDHFVGLALKVLFTKSHLVFDHWKKLNNVIIWI